LVIRAAGAGRAGHGGNERETTQTDGDKKENKTANYAIMKGQAKNG